MSMANNGNNVGVQTRFQSRHPQSLQYFTEGLIYRYINSNYFNY